MRLTSDWRSAGSNNKGNPGEPLFTFDEIADKIGLRSANLAALLHWHPGLTPWSIAGRGNRTIGAERRLYRLSDAKKWWWQLPVEVREKAKRK